MTDKEQIIIDGVDVSECEFYNPYYCGMYIDGYGDSEGVCSDYEDCYYKQLARKTQECEELKEKIKQIRNFRDKVISQLKEKNEKLKAESFTSDELISIQEKDIDRYLKALEGIERIATTFRARESSYHNVLDIISKAKENKQWD